MTQTRSYDDMRNARDKIAGKFWLVRVRVHQYGSSGSPTLIADTDPDIDAKESGATSCEGMRNALYFIIDILDQFDRYRVGLESGVILSKANSLRVSLSNGGVAQRVWSFTDASGSTRYDLEIMIARPISRPNTQALIRLVADNARPIRG